MSFPGPSETRKHLLPKLATKPWILPTPPPTLLRNCQVVDPESGTLLLGKRTIKIENGLIVELRPSSSSSSASLDSDLGAIEIDLKGAYVCPGLVDCHVHLAATPGVKSMQEFASMDPQVNHLRSTYVAKEMLLRGFTTVRDTGGASKSLAVALEEGLILGPRLVQCGKALSQTGGHGDFTAAGSGGSSSSCCGGSSHAESLGRVADGVPEVLKAAREEIKGGAEFLKIMCGGGVASETDAIDSIQYSEEEILAITTTAKRMGNKLVTAHAYTTEAIRHAVENGVGAIEHGNLADEECLKMMASKGIFLTPTLACYGIMVRPPFEDFLSDEGRRKNLEVMKRGLDALVMAEKAGVVVCYGSDLLASMHALQTEEFTIRAEVLSSPQILRHATTNAAKLLRQVGKIGVIAPGAYADLIVLKENPLVDVRVLDRPEKYLEGVMKGGRVVFGFGGDRASS